MNRVDKMKTMININLKKKEDFYSRYSNQKLNSELTDFIYNECYGEDYKNNIVINIYTKLKISKNEKNDMMDTIRRTFGLKVQDELYYYEKAKFKKTILFLIGIVLIVIYYLSFIEVLSEIILILGWLAIWESVYSFLADSSKDYIKIYRLRRLAHRPRHANLRGRSEQENRFEVLARPAACIGKIDGYRHGFFPRGLVW